MKLTSPNHPDPYDPLTNCVWNLTADQGKYISLEFESIEVSTTHTYLTPYTMSSSIINYESNFEFFKM